MGISLAIAKCDRIGKMQNADQTLQPPPAALPPPTALSPPAALSSPAALSPPAALSLSNDISAPPTAKDAVECFLRGTKRQRRPQTAHAYASDLRLIARCLGATDETGGINTISGAEQILREGTRRAIRLRDFFAANYSPARTNRLVSVMSGLHRTALEIGYPAAPLVLGGVLNDAEPPRGPSEKEFYSLLTAAADGEEKALILCLSWSKMRIGEALELRWKDININRNEALVFAKGGRRSLRCIPPQLAGHLATMRADRIGGENGRVFGGATHNRIWRLLRRICKRAGMTSSDEMQRCRPHGLRHFGATNSFANGADISIVQKLMGHQSVGSTMIYLDDTWEKAKAFMLALDEKKFGNKEEK